MHDIHEDREDDHVTGYRSKGCFCRLPFSSANELHVSLHGMTNHLRIYLTAAANPLLDFLHCKRLVVMFYKRCVGIWS